MSFDYIRITDPGHPHMRDNAKFLEGISMKINEMGAINKGEIK